MLGVVAQPITLCGEPNAKWLGLWWKYHQLSLFKRYNAQCQTSTRKLTDTYWAHFCFEGAIWTSITIKNIFPFAPKTKDDGWLFANKNILNLPLMPFRHDSWYFASSSGYAAMHFFRGAAFSPATGDFSFAATLGKVSMIKIKYFREEPSGKFKIVSLANRPFQRFPNV